MTRLADYFGEEATDAAALVRLAEVAERMAIDDLDRALPATEVLVRTADAQSDLPAQVRTRRARAQALAYAGRFEDALTVLALALERARLARDTLQSAWVHLTELHALAKLGRFDDAAAAGESARSIFLEHDEPLAAARADINLGVTHRMRGDHDRAISHFDRAREFVMDPVLMAQLESNRAEALLDAGRFAEAERAFRSALSGFRAAALARAEAIVEGNLADLMSRQGRLSEALAHFERARAILDREETEVERSRVLAEHAEAFAGAGLLDEARAGYDAAIHVLDDAGQTFDCARAMCGLAAVLIETGDPASVPGLLDSSDERFTELAHEPGLGVVRLLRGRFARRFQDVPSARRYLRDAMTGSSRTAALAALCELAWLELEHSGLDDSVDAPGIDDAVTEAAGSGLTAIESELRHVRGRIAARAGRWSAAVADLERASVSVERLRGALRGVAARSAFHARRAMVHVDLTTTLLEIDRVDDAFMAWQRARSRALFDLMSGHIECLEALRQSAVASSGSGGSEPSSALLDELVACEGAIHAGVQDDDAGRRAGNVGEIERLEVQRQELETRLLSSAEWPGARTRLTPSVASEELARQLDRDTLFLEYVPTGDSWSAFVVQNGALGIVRDLAPAEAVRRATGRLAFEMGRATRHAMRGGGASSADTLESATLALRTLHDLLLGPLVDRLDGVGSLIVAPAGPLHGIPFAALDDGSGPLDDRLTVSTVPGAAVLHALLQIPRATGPPVVAGHADDRAPRIDDEVRDVAALLGNSVALESGAATSQRIRAHADGAALLHLACHGRHVPGAPWRSGLRLADGWTTVRDLVAWRLDGTIVILSGCETGAVSESGFEDPVGLDRALLAAGAVAVVNTLWPVEDESARSVMAEFHELCHNGCAAAPAEALRAARRAERARRSHPVHWASFAVAGGLRPGERSWP